MKIIKLLMSMACILSLTHCASYDFSNRVVQQGNLLSQKKVSQLRVGMHKEDVATLMGTSLLNPLFNTNRWDYAYTWKKGNSRLEQRHLTLHFAGGKLTRIEPHP